MKIGDSVIVETEDGETEGTVSVVWADGTEHPALDILAGEELLHSVQHDDRGDQLPAWREA